MSDLFHVEILSLSGASLLKFGTTSQLLSPLSDVLSALVIGLVTGCAGAFFIYISSYLGIQRKKYINTPLRKISEVLIFSLVSATIFFWLPSATDNCKVIQSNVYDQEFYQYTCPNGQYSPLATLLFNTEGGTIRTIMNNNL